jgi:hypothetical protein
MVRRALPQRQQAGEPRAAGVIDVDAGRLASQAIGFGNVRLGRDHRPAAARQHAAHHAPPVVGLVVENAVRETVGLAFPRPHERGPLARRLRQRQPCRSGAALATQAVGAGL